VAPPVANPWQLPVTVLVNAETVGAPEALAAVLRAEDAALVIGGQTAGKAAVYRNIDLGNGTWAHLPVARVRVADGRSIPASGITPDIAVKARIEQERQYLSDPFTGVAASTNLVAGTNTIVASVTVRRRLNEAELVRARREGRPIPDFSETTPQIDDNHTIRDPSLARAVDLLKNLSILNRR
jgi:C-terminal processing protease CtpA/Prc